MSLLWVLAQASLLALGVWWCVEMIPRARRDLATLRQGDASDCVVVVVLWLATAAIVLLIIRFVARVVHDILGALGGPV